MQRRTTILAASLICSLALGCGDVTPTGEPTPPISGAAPIADAGPDQEVAIGDSVNVSGSASTAPAGRSLTFAWSIRSRPSASTVALSATDSVATQFTADALGTYVLELVVNDGAQTSQPAVAVIDARQRPIADAGLPRYAQIGTLVELDGQGSHDPAGEALAFAWLLLDAPAGSSATLGGSDTALPTFTADLAGTYDFELVVSTGPRTSDPDTVEIIATTEMPEGTFVPTEVYLFGTVAEGSCGRSAIAHWSDANTAWGGFDCYGDERSAVIRPTDGRVLYTNTFEDLLREFHCDDCPGWPASGSYPSNVLDNDNILPTPPCDPAGSYLRNFLVAPDDPVLHTCGGDWFDRTGATIDTAGQTPLALGMNDTALADGFLVDLVMGSTQAVSGWPTGEVYTIRALDAGGFWIVVAGDSGNADDQQLWLVGDNAVATLVGSYPALPANHSVSAWMSRLDGSGNLFQFGGNSVVFEDLVIRRELDGASEVVYTEADDPLVKLHISSLMTGP